MQRRDLDIVGGTLLATRFQVPPSDPAVDDVRVHPHFDARLFAERRSMKKQTQHSIDAQIEYCTWVLTHLIQVQAWIASSRLENTPHEVLNRQAEIVAAILETLRKVKDE